MEPQKPVILVVMVYLSEKIQIKVSKGKRYLGQNPGETMSGSYCPPSSGIIFFVVQLLSSVRLYVTPWTAAREAPLPFTISRALLKLTSHWVSDTIQPSHLLSPLLLLPSIFSSIRIFSEVSPSPSATVLPVNIQGWFRLELIDWFDLLVVQGTLKSLLQNNLKASIFNTEPSLWSNSHIPTWQQVPSLRSK